MFRNEKGDLVEQKVQYEWRPIICKFCQKYGHAEDDCWKKKPVQKLTDEQGTGETDQIVEEDIVARGNEKMLQKSATVEEGGPSSHRKLVRTKWITPVKTMKGTAAQ